MWMYEVWMCDAGYTKPTDHDGSCGAWLLARIYWGSDWIKAYERAAEFPHAYVQQQQVEDAAVAGKAVKVFEHIAGGGLCKGCFARHVNVHTEHDLNPVTGLCGPCIAVEDRRGPLTRTPGENEFMCEDCRAAFRRMHEQYSYQEGRDPNPRLYRPVLDVARKDAGTRGAVTA